MNSVFREIPLTRGYKARVDPEDYEDLVKTSWFALVTRGRVYAAHKPTRSTKTYLMHRLVAKAQDGEQVLFVNQSQTLDVRKSNLTIRRNKSPKSKVA